MTTRSSAEPITIRTVAPGCRFDRDEDLLRLILDAFEGQRGRVDPPSAASPQPIQTLERRRKAEWLVIAERAVSHDLGECLIAATGPGEF